MTTVQAPTEGVTVEPSTLIRDLHAAALAAHNGTPWFDLVNQVAPGLDPTVDRLQLLADVLIATDDAEKLEVAFCYRCPECQERDVASGGVLEATLQAHGAAPVKCSCCEAGFAIRRHNLFVLLVTGIPKPLPAPVVGWRERAEKAEAERDTLQRELDEAHREVGWLTMQRKAIDEQRIQNTLARCSRDEAHRSTVATLRESDRFMARRAEKAEAEVERLREVSRGAYRLSASSAGCVLCGNFDNRGYPPVWEHDNACPTREPWFSGDEVAGG